MDDFTVAGDLSVKNRTSNSYSICGNGVTPLAPVIALKGNMIFPATAETGAVYYGSSNPTGRFTTNVEGNLILPDSSIDLYSFTLFTGSADRGVTHTSGTIYGAVTLNKSPDMKLTLLSSLSTQGDISITRGILYTNGYDLTINGALYNNDRLRVQGGETLAIAVKDHDSGMVEYIGIGIVLLLFGIFSLTKNKRTKGLAFSIAGLLLIAVPFVASYLISR